VLFQCDGRATLAVALALTAVPLAAQAPAVAPAPAGTTETVPTPHPACCTVPARTPVEIEIMDAVDSRANHPMDHFAFRLAEPLTIDGHVIAPAGTPGIGEVVHAARARFGGKAGELILAARYLDLNGTHIPLRSLHVGPRQGHDSSATVNTMGMVAAATVPVLSLVGFMIAGGEVRVPAGTHANAMTATETVLAPVP
jgi:hypothetical protein